MHTGEHRAHRATAEMKNLFFDSENLMTENMATATVLKTNVLKCAVQTLRNEKSSEDEIYHSFMSQGNLLMFYDCRCVHTVHCLSSNCILDRTFSSLEERQGNENAQLRGQSRHKCTTTATIAIPSNVFGFLLFVSLCVRVCNFTRH